MQPAFVKKFDFRGIYNQDIKDTDAFYLGLAISKALLLKKVLIGWDTRKSSKNLAVNFMQALRDKDIQIDYLDVCPIDYVTAGAHAFDYDFSVMFTGSHNPWDWTGLLMHTQGGDSVEGELVTKIIQQYNKALSETYVPPTNDLADFHNVQVKIEEIYIQKIISLVPLDKIAPMHVLVDIGDGSGSVSVDVLEKLLPQVKFDRINDRRLYDEDSSHTADPSNVENMQELMQTVKNDAFACGFAFDSDADRVLAVDEEGNLVNGSLLGSSLIESFMSLGSSMQKFGYAVECGSSMYNAAVSLPSTAIPVPVGRSILRRMIRENVVDVAVENVGHFYIKDFFKTDSGAFSIIMTLYWISTQGKLSSLAHKHPDGQRTQFSLPLEDNQEAVLERLANIINEHFANRVKKKIEIDGIRYEFFEEEKLITWYAFRPSGYEPIEKYYFGSLNEDDYKYLQEKIKK